MSDPIHSLYEQLLSLIEGHGATLITLVMRMLLLFGIPTLLTMFLFKHENDSSATTWIALIIGVFFALEAPLQWVADLKPAFQFSILLSGSVILYHIPTPLSFYLVPELGRQRALRKWLHRIMLIILTVSLLLL